MARERGQQQANLEKFVEAGKQAREGDQKNQEQEKSLGERTLDHLKGRLMDVIPETKAAVLGAFNQGRMEAAHFFGKAFPEGPQFDDPAAAFNRTPLEGYQLKHGTGPYATQAMEMDKTEGPAKSGELSKAPEKTHELEMEP